MSVIMQSEIVQYNRPQGHSPSMDVAQNNRANTLLKNVQKPMLLQTSDSNP